MTLLSFSSVMSTVWAVILAILILLAMITVHEFGHYTAGKALKFKINEFAIGFGPKLFRRVSKKSGEAFSIRVLPLGGFCAFAGEDEEVESGDGFNDKAPWKRIIVLVAGPLMNYLLALILIVISLFSFGQMMFKVNGVAPDEEKYAAYSLCENDLICEVDGKGIYLTTDLMSALKGKKEGDLVQFEVLRNGERQTVEIMMRADCDFKNSEQTNKLWNALGIGTYQAEDGAYYWSISVENHRFGFFTTIGHSFVYSFKIAGSILRVIGELLTGRLGISAMGGPISTIKTTSEMASLGFQYVLEISALIGVNLAVFNLLPVPALDGSKIVFTIIEWIRGKPISRKVEAIIHAVGFVFLLGFAILVDVLQFV